MKNLFYIPFLVFMAVTYTRLADNYNVVRTLDFNSSRGPASVDQAEIENTDEDCPSIASRFNPHLSQKCL